MKSLFRPYVSEVNKITERSTNLTKSKQFSLAEILEDVTSFEGKQSFLMQKPDFRSELRQESKDNGEAINEDQE